MCVVSSFAAGSYAYADPASQDHGLYAVDLDGVSRQYDGYTAALKFGTLKYFAGNLNSSEHTLTITNNPGSTKTFFGESPPQGYRLSSG
jgi:hypothetical protein